MLTAITGVVVTVVTVVGIPNTLGNLCGLESKTKEAIRNDATGCMDNGFTRNDTLGCVEGSRGLQDSKELH